PCLRGAAPSGWPVGSVEGTRLGTGNDLFRIEGREAIRLEDRPVSVARLGDLLELSSKDGRQQTADGGRRDPVPPPAVDRLPSAVPDTLVRPCVILAIDDDRLGL